MSLLGWRDLGRVCIVTRLSAEFLAARVANGTCESQVARDIQTSNDILFPSSRGTQKETELMSRAAASLLLGPCACRAKRAHELGNLLRTRRRCQDAEFISVVRTLGRVSLDN